jgi:hypothetical protein
VTVPVDAVVVSRVIPELDGVEIWVNVNVLPVFPPVVAIDNDADRPTEVVIDVALEDEKRIGAATVIVTTLLTVAPDKSVAVIVSI